MDFKIFEEDIVIGIGTVLAPNLKVDPPDIQARRVTYFAKSVAKSQHERTLAWVRERLAAGEHLDDLLAEG